MARGKVELHLPGLVVGVDGIDMTGLWGRFGRARLPQAEPEQAKSAGPFLITSRDSGLALDTLQQSRGARVGVRSIDVSPHQLWYVHPSGVKGEATIICAANGLALDAARDSRGDPHPVTWDLDGNQGQRWQLLPTVDGFGFLVKAPHNDGYLTLPAAARDHLDEQWAPWFSAVTGNRDQEWVFSLPHGNL